MKYEIPLSNRSENERKRRRTYGTCNIHGDHSCNLRAWVISDRVDRLCTVQVAEVRGEPAEAFEYF